MREFIEGFFNTYRVIGYYSAVIIGLILMLAVFIIPLAVALDPDKYFSARQRIAAIGWLVLYVGIVGGVLNYLNRGV